MKQSEIAYETPNQPRQLRLDTTTYCNAECISCHRYLSDRNGTMDFDLIREIVRDVSRWDKPLDEIVPVNYGEFFSYPKWEELLTLLEDRLTHTQVVIPTNGFYLDANKVKIICEHRNISHINFSVNAFFEETYEAFMGLRADTIIKVEKALQLIRMLRPDIKRWVSMVFDPEYQTDLEKDKFTKYWSNLANIVWTIPAASAGRPEKSVVIPRYAPCRSIFSDIVIGFDRQLSSCCFDAGFQINIGNYTGHLISDWKNEKLENMRYLHNLGKRGMIDLCKRCTYA